MSTTKETARQKIQALIDEYHRLRQKEPTYFERMSETDVVNKFITPLLDALGWPTQGSAYRQEVHTAAGRPDIRAEYSPNTFIYVEAKRFGVIDKFSRKTLSGVITPGQMMLPGMATDRTKEEQQAINYAFANDGAWAILTNFERFRLFNARRDWLVFSIEEPSGYLDEDFEYLWQLAWHNIQNGSLDNLSNQRARADVDNDYLNFINEWRLKLAKDILARRTENWWAFHDDGSVDLRRLRSVVQRLLDRLVVIRYAEDHLIAPAGTLWNLFELSRSNPYAMPFNEQMRHLYRNFDRMHNSALFAEGDADKASLSSAVLEGLVEKLYEARFRAMTPDIMGNTYEQYLGKALAFGDDGVDTRDNLETRKKQGSYYTPQVIVRYIVDNSLGRYLYGTQNGQPDGEPLPDGAETRKTHEQIANLRLIDPACGSGSFLIYAYEVLARFYRLEIRRIEEERQARYDALVAEGVTTPFDLQVQLTPFKAAIDALGSYPRLILERHLYGVDLDPQAAEIATVNLIMRAMADQRGREKRLPLILNQNVKVGNALIGAGPTDPRYANHAADLAELRRLRLQIVNEPHGHDAMQTQIETVTQRVSDALNGEIAPYFENDVPQWEARIRPFHWAVGFPELFVDAQGQSLGEAAGFTIVVGNPPWEIVKPDLREYYAQFDPLIESKLTRKKAEVRIKELNAIDPDLAAGWEAQQTRITATASYYKAADDYTRQGRGDTATHKLFTERAYTLLADKGRLGYVIPSGIYSDLGTKDLREMMIADGAIESLFSFTNGVSGGETYFPDVHRSFKITLLILKRGNDKNSFFAAFKIDPREVPKPSNLLKALAVKSAFIPVKTNSLEQFSPNSLSLMEFKSSLDYEIMNKIYRDKPHFGAEVEDGWNPNLSSEFHMTSARGVFNQEGKGYPLFEGKSIYQFEIGHHEPRYWVEPEKGRAKVLGRRDDENQLLGYQKYRLAFRDIARSTDHRTWIAAIIPPEVFAGNTLVLEESLDQKTQLFLLSAINSFVIDYIIRQKIGTHVSMFYANQVPLPRLEAGNAYFDAIVPRAAALTCVSAAFADLWQEVMGTDWEAPDATQTYDVLETSYVYRPTTNPAARQVLRDELDAIVAHLYGLSRDEFAHILGTFPLVFPNTPEGAAKKAQLLTTYDKFASL